MTSLHLLIPFFILIISGLKGIQSSRVFTIINKCQEMVWPGIFPGQSFGGGGFALKPGQSVVFTAPVGWSGRIWGRTGCKFDSSGNGSCQTGDCRNTLKCSFSGESPASLAEFTLATPDFYDVSLVDGFNLPIKVAPVNGKGNCSQAGCDSDLRESCPSELAVKSNGKTVACRSACTVFQTDRYCCKGVFGNAATCQPTTYSKAFKAACPRAYSYAFDDPTSIFTCSGTDYIITFCATKENIVCTYHDNRLVCNGSSGFHSLYHKWQAMLIYALVIFSFIFLKM